VNAVLRSRGESAVRIVLLYPELLGTYGDGGNATILARRLAWRGIAAEVTQVAAHEAVPAECDMYVLGGGEDGPQVEATRELASQGVLHRSVDRGAVVFAVCAGLQLVGNSFPGRDGGNVAGLGLLDCVTERTGESRAVGELLVAADPRLGVGELTGFENHAGRTRVGPDARALGTVIAGVGNGSVGVTADGGRTEGAVATDGTRVLGTYLHGPALARNPALADLLLGWVVGDLPDLDADHRFVDDEADALRRDRLAAVHSGNLDGVLHRTWRDRLLGRN
jgi:lipid II isoglutaminyl synthase (glutamine-hydrolysing)